MKKLIIILISLITIPSFAAVYYVATNGDNGAAGTIGAPWATFHYATTQVYAGDTVFFRGGTYYHTTAVSIYRGGSEGNPISFINYPGEIPIIDGSNYPQGSAQQQLFGIYSISNDHLVFKGLTVRRIRNIHLDNGRAHAFYAQSSNDIVYEQCVADSIAGRGFQVHNCTNVRYYNCDAIWCADPQLADPGNGGTGFIATRSGTPLTGDMSDSIVYRGCRGWFNSDQAFASSDYYTVYDSCWAFLNGLSHLGYTSGAQNGFKPGYSFYDIDSIQVLMKNSLSIFNRSYGLNENTDGSTTSKINYRVYNNIIAKNGNAGIISTRQWLNLDNINRYVNNISYDNASWDFMIQTAAEHYYNSWDAPYYETAATQYFNSPASVSDSDFKDIPADSAECYALMTAARQADGSLPDLGDNFKLRSTSDLIDQGLDVGLPYNGSAPDIGAFEYNPAAPPAPPDVATGLITKLTPSTAEVRVTITYDGGDDIIASGVCWSTSTDPTISDSLTITDEQEGIFETTMTGLAKGTTYYVRAYATNVTATSYGENVIYSTPAVIRVKDGTTFQKWNGQFIDW